MGAETGTGRDRWASLAEYAGEASTNQNVYYRWLDYLNQPVNAEEYGRGGEVVHLWQDMDEKWVVRKQFRRSSEGGRRSFAVKAEAAAALEAEGFAYRRTIPMSEIVESHPEVSGLSGSGKIGALVLSMALIVLVLSSLIWVVWFVFGSRVGE